MHRWVDHTGEMELWVGAPTVEQLFREAALALGEAMMPAPPPGAPPLVRHIAVDAPDRAALLVEWLSEIVFLAETEGLVPASITGIAVGPASAAGDVRGVRGTAAPIVKAVTYHGLSVAERDGDWEARVVLDV